MKKRILAYLFALLILGGTVLIPGFGGMAASAEAGSTKKTPSIDEADGKRFAALTGTISGQLIENRYPNAQVSYFETQADSVAALMTGKVDLWASDEPVVRFLQIENPAIKILDGYLAESNLAAVFAKTEAGKALCGQYSAFVDSLWADGTMKEIDDIWFGADDSKRTVLDYEHLPAPNGTLRMAADLIHPPFAYMKDGRAVGYDVDVAARFCREYGYGLVIESMSFGGMLPAVQSGKVDFAATSITVTKERAESVLFSTPDYYGGIVLAMWDKDAAAAAGQKGSGSPASDAARPEDPQSSSQAGKEDGSLSGIEESFEKTFIREDRWKLFADGVLTTLLITLMSILFGTILGFGIFMMCRNGNPAANLITRFCLWLVQGMPMVVLLMILYYIIFGSVAISGMFVAVIGFTLTFGAAVFGLLKMGVGAVDNGQYEAAYALGYSSRRTFFKVILPQALPHVLPAYRGEIVSLIKATAVVGYIAVQDLTKMGDIVRSRTYEAFFPLIAVTVIYFLLEGLIGFLVSRITLSFNPERRSRESILKGVKTDD